MKVDKRFKIALWGWWQGKNLGDLWIMESMKKRFSGVIPINTSKTQFNEYDFVIIGGGGLLNGPHLKHPFNKKLETNYGTFGIGGEFEIEQKDLLKKFINKSKFFGVRDRYNLNTYNINQESKLEISGDCTFLYPLKRNQRTNNYKINNIKLIWRDPYKLLRWNTIPGYGENGEKLNTMFKNHIGPLNGTNEEIFNNYKKLLKNKGNVNIDVYSITKYTENIMLKRYKNIDLVVSMRYHGIVASIQLGIPCIALDIYPKVRTLMQDAGLEDYCIKLNEVKKMPDLIKKIEKNYSSIYNKMKKYTDEKQLLVNKFADVVEYKLKYLSRMKIKNL